MLARLEPIPLWLAQQAQLARLVLEAQPALFLRLLAQQARPEPLPLLLALLARQVVMEQ